MPPFPYNLRILKGEKNVAVTRKFAEFATESTISFDLYNWLQLTAIADEHFYSTLASITSFNDQVKADWV
jgi:hypothetical protein